MLGFSILVNSVQGLDISCKRGLRQGDPLSPLIIVLVANGSRHMIFKCRMTGFFDGLGCWDESNSIINLHYVDDTLIFGKESLPQTMIHRWILFCFERWSRLKFNFHNSSLVFLEKIPVSSFLISLVSNCPIQRLPVTYLGLSLVIGRLKRFIGGCWLTRLIENW